MPDDRSLWRLATEAGAALAAYLSPTLRHYESETGLGGWTWFMLLRAYLFEPAPATIASFLHYSPYNGTGRFRPHLKAGVETGYLQEEEQGVYRLTERGRSAVEQFVEDLRTVMAVFDPLSPQDGEHLANLLDRLVQASLKMPPPNSLKRIDFSYKLMPGRIPPLPFSEQAISCLAAYRDDAHVAAWNPTALSGPALESLTLLWRVQADSLDALHKRLVRRAHSRQVYRDALDELRGRGFIEGSDEALVVTESGRAYRQQVEDDTDRLFFAPWACLDTGDKAELADLLTQLRDGLQA